MSIESGLYLFLTTNHVISPVVSTRVYPKVVPQGQTTFPVVTYQRISTPRFRSHDGEAGLAHPRFQLNCWDPDYLDARALADTIRREINDTNNWGAWDDTTVQAVHVLGEGDMDYVPSVERERARHGRRLDIEIWHEEST